MQNDGKIILAGSAAVSAVAGATNYDFFVARLTDAGALDTTFGGTGFVLADFGSATEEARALAIQGDGGIVVAAVTGDNIAQARFTSAGVLDGGFGTGGKVTTDLGGADQARAIALQTDEKIVVGGTNGGDFAALRYTTGGVLDITFDGDGIATINLGNSVEAANGVGIDSTGRIVLGGNSGSDIGFARLTAAGVLDASFGAGGVKVIDSGAGSVQVARSLSVLNGDAVALGGSNLGDVFGVRITSAGVPDAGYGTNGVARATLPGGQSASGFLALADGTVIVAGSASGDSLLVQIGPDGNVDTGFGAGGAAVTGFSRNSPALATAMLIQPDGKIVVGGENGLGHELKDFAARPLQCGRLDRQRLRH